MVYVPRERALADRAAAGDREALGQLYLQHRERLLAIVRSRLGPGLREHLESADVLQSAFLDAVRDYSVTGARDAFLPWIARAVERAIIDRARYFHAEKRAGAIAAAESELGPSPGPSPSVLANAREERLALERAISKLSKTDAELIRLSKLQGKTAPQIATILGKSRDAVEKALTRAMLRLTKAFAMERKG